MMKHSLLTKTYIKRIGTAGLLDACVQRNSIRWGIPDSARSYWGECYAWYAVDGEFSLQWVRNDTMSYIVSWHQFHAPDC